MNNDGTTLKAHLIPFSDNCLPLALKNNNITKNVRLLSINIATLVSLVFPLACATSPNKTDKTANEIDPNVRNRASTRYKSKAKQTKCNENILTRNPTAG
jgi:hypothetical protein